MRNQRTLSPWMSERRFRRAEDHSRKSVARMIGSREAGGATRCGRRRGQSANPDCGFPGTASRHRRRSRRRVHGSVLATRPVTWSRRRSRRHFACRGILLHQLANFARDDVIPTGRPSGGRKVDDKKREHQTDDRAPRPSHSYRGPQHLALTATKHASRITLLKSRDQNTLNPIAGLCFVPQACQENCDNGAMWAVEE